MKKNSTEEMADIMLWKAQQREPSLHYKTIINCLIIAIDESMEENEKKFIEEKNYWSDVKKILQKKLP